MWKDHYRITNKYHELLIHHCRVESNKVHINIFKCNPFSRSQFLLLVLFFNITLAKTLSIFTGFKFETIKNTVSHSNMSLSRSAFPHLNKSTFQVFLLAQNQILFSSAHSDLSE